MLDDLVADAKGYRDALHVANLTDPWVKVLVCICLAQQRALVNGGLASVGCGCVLNEDFEHTDERS